MPIDEFQIEQLVLDEMSGIITPEDSATLNILLEDPAAMAIRNAIYEQFAGEEEQAFLALLPENLPVKKVWARIRRKRRNRIFTITALSITALSLIISSIIFRP